MAATRASGTNAVRYGTMKDNVLALKVVLANGSTITTARRAKKSSSGYDLTRLFVGSEGTLGIITEITLRLHGIPEAIAGGVCPFPSVEAACNATIATIQSGIPVARIESLDDIQVKASNAYSKLALPERHACPRVPCPSAASRAVERFGEIAAEHGAACSQWTAKAEDARGCGRRARAYWPARSGRRQGIRHRRACRWSRLASADETTRHRRKRLLSPSRATARWPFPLLRVIDMDDPAEVSAAKAFAERLVERALAMEGTCSGEHGVGQGKMKYLPTEHGEALAVMRALKNALDPDGLMNPGKLAALS